MGNFSDEFNELVPEFQDEEADQEVQDSDAEADDVGEEEVPPEEDSSPEDSEGSEEGDGEGESDSSDGGEPEESGEATPVEDPTSEPSSQPEPDLVAELREQNKTLMTMLEKMGQTATPPQEKAPEEPEPPKIPETVEELLAGTDLDEVFSDREKFVGLLGQVAMLAREQAVQRVATTLPQYVIQQVKQQEVLQKATESFYSTHQSLVPFKKAVGIVTNEVVEEHPDWDLPKVLDEVAERSYKLLNLKRQAENQPPATPTGGKKPKPAFNKASSGRRNTPKELSGLQKEIADLIS